ncbi:MAG: Mce-associated rane protein [Pseudonocardiales bacterium]|nr:Mce-associated rane protein [Pseudonocardiales bacterium]
MPPSRRRPIPTPPAGGRPKVAGLHRRGSEVPADEEAVAPGAPEIQELAEEQEADELKAPEAVEWTPPPATAKKPAAKKKAAEPVAEPAAPSRPSWILPVALVVVGVLLGGLGGFFLYKSRAVSYDAALVDSATTSAVNGQIREAVEKSFSYNFADVESTEKAARELLTGKALCQYNAVFGPVKEVAPQQKLVVTVRVVSSAVSSLKDGRATVLVFADQVTTRTTDNQSGGGTAMLRVSAIDDGGRWKIDNMEMFGATADQSRQLQGC